MCNELGDKRVDEAFDYIKMATILLDEVGADEKVDDTTRSASKTGAAFIRNVADILVPLIRG